MEKPALCPKLEINRSNCTCTKETCHRKGMCCECVMRHRKMGNLPSCLRDMNSGK